LSRVLRKGVASSFRISVARQRRGRELRCHRPLHHHCDVAGPGAGLRGWWPRTLTLPNCDPKRRTFTSAAPVTDGTTRRRTWVHLLSDQDGVMQVPVTRIVPRSKMPTQSVALATPLPRCRGPPSSSKLPDIFHMTLDGSPTCLHERVARRRRRIDPCRPCGLSSSWPPRAASGE
jgi:hypothetical protein